MRLPPHVVRRRQGLYLRLRLPPDLARASGRSHVLRTLRTSDPAEARGKAAAESAAMHMVWEKVRLENAGMFLGKRIDTLARADLSVVTDNPDAAGDALEALSPQDRAALARRLKNLLAEAEDNLEEERQALGTTEMLVSIHDRALGLGVADGLRQAIALGGGPKKPRAHAEAAAPWTSFAPKFFASRPGLSASTIVSYQQAFKEFEAVIGGKPLADLEARDVARYSEWLEAKANARGKSGILNRKTLVRLTGHVRSFTGWAKSAGLIAEDPGADIEVRQRTKIERGADEAGAKRAFTEAELTRFFGSPLFTGCLSRHYRSRPGSHVFRDASWWIFVVAYLSGGRVEELAQAPAALADLGGVPCLDLRHASKTLAAPRLVPLCGELQELGLPAWAAAQQAAGRRMFEGPGSSSDWSKWCNRYLDGVLGEDATVSFHSFRHAFRAACAGSGLDDYVADKLLGHRSKKGRSEGSGYGRALTPDEARLFTERFRAPVSLTGLRRGV